MKRFVQWMGVLLAVLSVTPSTPGVQTPPTSGTVPAAPAVTGALGGQPLDEPLRLVREAANAFAGVRDYTCLFIKRERLGDQLQPDHLIAMKVRHQPFSVYLRWLGPKSVEGQEACYVAGRHNGMMRVHATGFKSIAGFVTIDPRDPRVAQNSRHTITEAGIGNLIMRLSQQWELERRLNQTQVRMGDYVYNHLLCRRVEVTHAGNAGGQMTSCRCVVYFDKASHLPIRVERYDWPRRGGAADGELLESYSYVNLRLNPGLPDADFDH
jgi:hypothetical protein